MEGELFQKRQELIQPIQDMVFEELKDIASGAATWLARQEQPKHMLYTNPKYDISDRLIKALGFVSKRPLSLRVEKEEENPFKTAKDVMNKGCGYGTDPRSSGRCAWWRKYHRPKQKLSRKVVNLYGSTLTRIQDHMMKQISLAIALIAVLRNRFCPKTRAH